MEFESPLPCPQDPPPPRPVFIPGQINPVHSTHFISLRSILIIFTHLCLGLPSDLNPYGFPTKTQYAFLSFNMPCPSYSPWLDHSNYTWWRVQVTTILVMQFSPHHITSSLFGPIFSSAPCLQTPSVYFFPLPWERNFAPIKNYRKNYNFVYSTQLNRRQNVLDWVVASITRVNSYIKFLSHLQYWHS
jgi:hypothetical protein